MIERAIRVALLALVAAACLAGCANLPEDTIFACGADAGCPSGEVCLDGLCERVPAGK